MTEKIKYSKEMGLYFARFKKDSIEAYKLAQKAREKGYDPASKVEITIAETMAERVIGLISVMAPQIVGQGAEKRIEELEERIVRLEEENVETTNCLYENANSISAVDRRIDILYEETSSLNNYTLEK